MTLIYICSRHCRDTSHHLQSRSHRSHHNHDINLLWFLRQSPESSMSRPCLQHHVIWTPTLQPLLCLPARASALQSDPHPFVDDAIIMLTESASRLHSQIPELTRRCEIVEDSVRKDFLCFDKAIDNAKAKSHQQYTKLGDELKASSKK